ncbi:hypothetical protein HanHA300_Chr04g0143171 [Helianthus annuus]|nr:hypothetical protein HanHA300_Chr04g0143171 [Helianthus annuus]KAJ0589632.1 hypothetical protein HanIR_Chr04g0188461 [Helianthus annuus]KAJ0597588.1 hypothetical protein HanHA89_Chr04g0156361 [Helianthus annuus]KAJ0758234.1 hypothetical protein HanLR1_Chr04g0148071 [Helianthus annuus]KAJ0761893.1 hypothetical protein HanOQP8_Chr04g0155271 [Helianthus annuus]
MIEGSFFPFQCRNIFRFDLFKSQVLMCCFDIDDIYCKCLADHIRFCQSFFEFIIFYHLIDVYRECCGIILVTHFVAENLMLKRGENKEISMA